MAAGDWTCKRLLESDGYGTEIEASLLKWVWYSMQACLFAGAEGIGRFFIEDFALHLLPFVCVEPKRFVKRVFRRPLRLSASFSLV